MAADPLAILFGSQARVKLLRFFLFNPQEEFTIEDISRRARLVRRTAQTELQALTRAQVIKKKQVYVVRPGETRRTKTTGYVLNRDFPQINALQTFLFETAPIEGKTLLRHMRKAGTVDFMATAGIFSREFDRRVDVLIGMKKLSDAKVEAAIRSLEAEIGMELRFAAFTTDDLKYRVAMYDKLTRDVFDYPHQVLVDRAGVINEIRRM